MEAKRKKIWNLTIATLIGVIVLVLTFIPVASFVADISTVYNSTNYGWGPMGGPTVDEGMTTIIFLLIMAAYLWLVAAMTIQIYKFIKT